jgi:hypothetical protein
VNGVGCIRSKGEQEQGNFFPGLFVAHKRQNNFARPFCNLILNSQKESVPRTPVRFNS